MKRILALFLSLVAIFSAASICTFSGGCSSEPDHSIDEDLED